MANVDSVCCMLMGLSVQTETQTNPLLKIIDVCTKYKTQLISMYANSQAECCRNGKLTMEIGSSRENDLKAVLKWALGDLIKCEIDNCLPEDVYIDDQKVSIKHSSSVVGKGSIKAKWTSDNAQAQKYIAEMQEGPLSLFTNMLLVYIDLKHQKITLVCVTDVVMHELVKKLKSNAFRCSQGKNNRGVEYTPELIKLAISKALFIIKLSDVTFKNGLDPIARRIVMLNRHHDDD